MGLIVWGLREVGLRDASEGLKSRIVVEAAGCRVPFEVSEFWFRFRFHNLGCRAEIPSPPCGEVNPGF